MLVRFVRPRGSFRVGECTLHLSAKTERELLAAGIVEAVVPSYENPKGGPLVLFNGPVQYTRDEIAAACRKVGSQLTLPAGCGLDGARVLWALAGAESGFGRDCRPRHEMGYCRGKYAENPVVVALTGKYGHAAHASFGPWQVMLVNLGVSGSPAMFDTAADCARIAAVHINGQILRWVKTITLAQIADAYNTGNFRDSNVPADYIAKVAARYDEPMPAARVVPQ